MVLIAVVTLKRNSELESNQRVQTHATCCIITITVTFQPQTMSLLGYPKVIPYTKFEHFGIIRF